MAQQWSDGERWPARKWAAWLTRGAVTLLPIVAAVLVAIGVASALPEPTTLLPTLGWWIAVVGSSLLASYLVQRAASKLLPLAALLNMSLLFPDVAPSRFRIALRSGSSGLLRKEIERSRAAGTDDDPTRAAEFALTLVASLGKHDRTTRGHAERTRAYTDLIADELGLPEGDRDRLRWAALLHDIGKVKVDADILQKDSRLDDSEWDIVREHPTLGYELVAPIRQFLGPWAQTILHHHERFDGLGYPSGVSGDDIALGARIVAVADAYDAMTAARTYQEPIPRKAALTELTSGAGSQFDPAIVRAFLQISAGAVRSIIGPFVVLAQLPFIGGLRRLADSGALVTAALVGILVPIAAGIGPGTDEITEPQPVVAQVPVAAEGAGVSGTVSATPPPASGVTSTSAVPVFEPSTPTVDSKATSTSSTSTSTTSTSTTSTTSGPTSSTTPPSTTSGPTPTTSTTTSPSSTTTTTTTTLPPPTTSTSTTPPVPTTTTTTTSVPAHPPTAASDFVATDEDTAATVDVLANDFDVDGDMDPSSLRIVGAAGSGSASVVAGFGPVAIVISYVPDPDTNGTDSFTYEVCDRGARCSTGSVVVDVAPVNDAPVAVDDIASAWPRTPVQIAVRANDSDVDGDVFLIQSFDSTSYLGGTVSCSTTCTYTPPDEWSTNDEFTYTIVDGAGASDVATVTIIPLLPDLRWYLRAAAPGDTASTPKLPLSLTAGPSNATLPNLDTNRDSSPGLLLAESSSGIAQQLAESDPTKFQMWTYPVAEDLHLFGSASVSMYAGMEGLAADLDARIRVFLLDCPVSTPSGSNCSTIALATVTRRPWSDTPGVWVGVTADLGDVDYPVVAGRALGVKVVVAGGESDDDMWLAFDTSGFVSVLWIAPSAPAAIAHRPVPL